jgi:hypothetical protein
MVFVYPHPQAMSLLTGQMAFGTIEHARLESMKIEIMNALGFFTGIMAGYRAFNLMPLSTDQVWSPVQVLLDIENLENANKLTDKEKYSVNCAEELKIIGEVIDSGSLFAGYEQTLLKMFENYETETFMHRYFSSESWIEAGSPYELHAVEPKVNELTGKWNFRPEQDKLEKILDIYTGMCRKFNTEPLKLD